MTAFDAFRLDLGAEPEHLSAEQIKELKQDDFDSRSIARLQGRAYVIRLEYYITRR